MPIAPKSFRANGSQTRKQREASWQSRRNGNHDLYNLWAWRKPDGLRQQILMRDSLCVECAKRGRFIPATEADHIKPHKGDMSLFLDIDNGQGLCKSCHSEKTMREQHENKSSMLPGGQNLW